MKIEVREKAFADSLAGATLKEHIVRKHHCGTAAILQHQHHVLEEVKLVVLGLYIEVLSVQVHRTCWTLTERRIGKNHIHQRLRLSFQRVLASDGATVCAHTMQIEVHRGERDHKRRDIHAT